MRLATLFLLACLAANAAQIGFVQPRVGGNTMAAWWTFNNGVGTDFSGQGRTLVLTNSPANTNGQISTALFFNGTSAAAYSIGNVGLNTNRVTISFWMRTTNNGSAGPVFLEMTTNYNTGNGFIVYMTSASAGKIVAADHNVGVGYLARNAPAIVNSGNWTHLGIVIDRSLGTNAISIYTNGVAASTAIEGGNNTALTGNFTDATFYLAARNANQSYVQGAFDDLRVYNATLTAEEIKSLYNMRGVQ